MSISVALSAVRIRQLPLLNLYYEPSLPKDLVQVLGERPDKLIGQGRTLREKAVRRTALVEWGHQRYVLKHYIESTWWRAVKHSFSRSRGWRAWSNARRLADAKVVTPVPVACLESPLGRLRGDSYFMYRYVEGETLESYFSREPSAAAAGAILGQLRRIWDRLRAMHISLTDTHVRNFIVTPAAQLCIIDVDDLRVHNSALVTAHYQARSWKRLLRSVPSAYIPAA